MASTKKLKIKNKVQIIDSGKMNSLLKRFDVLIDNDFARWDQAIIHFLQVDESGFYEAEAACKNIDNEITAEYKDIYLTAQAWLQAGEITHFQYAHLQQRELELREAYQNLLDKHGLNLGDTE